MKLETDVKTPTDGDAISPAMGGNVQKGEKTMRADGASKKDWKLFRSKLPLWQEAYMERLIQEYIELLESPGNASDRFWALDERIRQDKRCAGVIVRLSRTDLHMILLRLLRERVIGTAELSEFSEELQERIQFLLGEGEFYQK
jgi:hypothetical protein